jgi:4-amino-4-deoxy-L-arabinose transferase-like glycosyltransferase
MLENKLFRRIFILMTLTALVSYFFGFFVDFTRDAGKYATVAKEIVQHGNYINLTVHGDPYDQKPPMLFWLGALGFHIGGISNFWFKLPVFLLILFGIFSTYKLGRSLYNKNTGLIAASLLFFSVIYSLYSMDIHTDTPLQAFVAFALWQLYEFIKSKRTINCFWGFVGIGLAMLSKGPIGMAIPGFAVGGHLLLSKNYKSLIDYRWYLGILVAFIVASPALIGLYNQFGWGGIEFFFWGNNVGRMTGEYVSANNTDYLFYVHNLAYLFLPWSLLFFAAAFLEFQQLFKNKFKAHEYYTTAGIWVFFLIISVSRSKLPNYMFILFPLIAVLTAKWINEALVNKEKLFKPFFIIQNIVTGLLWIIIWGLTLYFFPSRNPVFWILWLAFLTLTLFVYRKIKDKAARLLLPSIIAVSALMLYLNASAFPFMFKHQAPPKAARYYNEHANEGENLYNYRYGQYELFFYSEPEAKQLENFKQLKQIAQEKGAWVFTDETGIKELKEFKADIDTTLEFKHLYLHEGGKFILPSKREKVLKPLYLVKLK